MVEVADARAPFSSRNPVFMILVGTKPHLLLLSKADWADPEITKSWVDFNQNAGLPTLASDLKKESLLKRLSILAEPLVAKKREKEKKVGM